MKIFYVFAAVALLLLTGMMITVLFRAIACKQQGKDSFVTERFGNEK